MLRVHKVSKAYLNDQLLKTPIDLHDLYWFNNKLVNLRHYFIGLRIRMGLRE